MKLLPNQVGFGHILYRCNWNFHFNVGKGLHVLTSCHSFVQQGSCRNKWHKQSCKIPVIVVHGYSKRKQQWKCHEATTCKKSQRTLILSTTNHTKNWLMEFCASHCFHRVPVEELRWVHIWCSTKPKTLKIWRCSPRFLMHLRVVHSCRSAIPSCPHIRSSNWQPTADTSFGRQKYWSILSSFCHFSSIALALIYWISTHVLKYAAQLP